MGAETLTPDPPIPSQAGWPLGFSWVGVKHERVLVDHCHPSTCARSLLQELRGPGLARAGSEMGAVSEATLRTGQNHGE